MSQHQPQGRDVTANFFDCGKSPAQKIADSNAAWARIKARQIIIDHTPRQTHKLCLSIEKFETLKTNIIGIIKQEYCVSATYLAKNCPHGKNTIYNAINQLLEDGEIIKFKSNGYNYYSLPTNHN